MLKLKRYLLLALLPFAPAFGGTTDVLYVTDGDHGAIQAIQGDAIIYENTSLPSSLAGPTLYPIAVRDTVWLASYITGEPGRLELDNSLVLTGNSGSVELIPSGHEALDGAADGNYNYTIDDENGNVYRYNADWSGTPALVFTSACEWWCPGITYDPVNDSFWIADWANIHEYSPTGNLRSSFAHGADDAGGLAYEPSTDTLWMVENHPNRNTLRQYSKAGSLLDTVTTSTDYALNVWGAEFVSTAEPRDSAPSTPIPSLSTWGLLLLAGFLAVVAMFTWHRKVLQ